MKAILTSSLLIAVMVSLDARAQQITIGRIEQMPNMPAPYEMRDWRQVALGYDTFVFDLEKTGTYLPLVWINTSTVNYPDHDSFGLETVVGTPRVNSAEAINVLPALVGASLVGIDKSSQNGRDWVLMSEEFFNRRPEENVYLNLPVTSSGDDWWYETMPNVFFYQLYDLYRGTGDFEHQFTTVAEQFLTAVTKMGGGSAPWTVPNMNHRAWSFATMRPLTSGVKEPEAAGAFAWLLYHAYAETGDDRYRVGAEWAMEFLDSRTSNPAYELQLPYGVYTAARMNAELGTSYNVEKMVNWCFDVGPLRNWGSLVGTWGGYDIHGLIGEESFNDYAFLMNGFQQAGALAPMTRYDDRFARSIGKWILNLANASRLLYPKFLPAENQDSEEWSFEYDPESYVGHEAMRQEKFGLSPFATGDAVAGGWGYTNLALYGSSHVGYLGGVIDTTDVEGILRIDLLKTDFFGPPAYPTYLYFNPYDDDRTVAVDLGSGVFDLYDAVSNQMVLEGASGNVNVTLPGDQAMMLVHAPAGGSTTTEENRTLIDGVVVDWNSGAVGVNREPRIKALAASPGAVFQGEDAAVFCTAEDPDGNDLTYSWSSSGGQIEGDGDAVSWTPPAEAGDHEISCHVADGHGGTVEETITVRVYTNHLPVIESVTAEPPIVLPGESAQVTCEVSDADGDPLTFSWEASAGSFAGDGPVVTWTAPAVPLYALVRCRVTDDEGASSVDSVGIVVGDLVAYYPFDGDANDASGFENHAVIKGAVLVDDPAGNPNSAFHFDGKDDALIVASHPSLDFREAMTVALWMRPDELPERESFLISHGSWQNRWKLSITPEWRLRWTVKTVSAVKDLDSSVILAADSLHHVAATYGGGGMQLFVDGLLDAEIEFTGPIASTNIDLTIGQMVPGNIEWNFGGLIDDVRIYNRVLEASEVADLVGISTAVDDLEIEIPEESALAAPYPNPFTDVVSIEYDLAEECEVTIDIFDIAGRRIVRLFSGDSRPGRHRLVWSGADDVGRSAARGVYIVRMSAGSHTEHRRIVRL